MFICAAISIIKHEFTLAKTLLFIFFSVVRDDSFAIESSALNVKQSLVYVDDHFESVLRV